jgi:hypothetical protein
MAQSAERKRNITQILKEEMVMIKFRFQDLEIWQMAIEIADELFDIADELELKRLYRFAEQLSASGMSMPNNCRKIMNFKKTLNK